MFQDSQVCTISGNNTSISQRVQSEKGRTKSVLQEICTNRFEKREQKTQKVVKDKFIQLPEAVMYWTGITFNEKAGFRWSSA